MDLQILTDVYVFTLLVVQHPEILMCMFVSGKKKILFLKMSLSKIHIMCLMPPSVKHNCL